jgi:endo-1,4-beta-mannosidase
MTFRLGINYWPVSSAMYWWRHFDVTEVAQDFARIRAAGFDTVRLFLRWEDFQPRPERVAPAMLTHLVTVADIAAHNTLALMPTLFTGHMSGVNWIPSWALTTGQEPSRFRVVSGDQVVRARLKNWYSDATILQAQRLLAREVAAALGQHPALWAYDLGNEHSNCVVPPSRVAAVAWLEAMADAIRAVDATHPITLGLHMEDLEEDRRLGPGEAARVCDFLCMHGYPLYATWATSATDAMLLPFLGLITRWLGGDKEVLFAEFGAPTMPQGKQHTAAVPRTFRLLDEVQAALFTRRALAALHRFGFLGALLWCYGDYAPALWCTPPLDEAVHERFFGLWRHDYAAKPALAEVRPFAERERCAWHDTQDWLDMAPDEFYTNPQAHLRRLYQRFRRHYDAEEGGERPQTTSF